LKILPKTPLRKQAGGRAVRELVITKRWSCNDLRAYSQQCSARVDETKRAMRGLAPGAGEEYSAALTELGHAVKDYLEAIPLMVEAIRAARALQRPVSDIEQCAVADVLALIREWEAKAKSSAATSGK
jgi:hypothetical protein